MPKVFTSIGEPDQTPQNAVSDLGPHCQLPFQTIMGSVVTLGNSFMVYKTEKKREQKRKKVENKVRSHLY